MICGEEEIVIAIQGKQMFNIKTLFLQQQQARKLQDAQAEKLTSLQAEKLTC